MKKINDVAKEIDNFLNSGKKEIEVLFGNGFFIKLKKRSKSKIPHLEIHTSGFDGVIELEEAIDWISWELLDCKANNILA